MDIIEWLGDDQAILLLIKAIKRTLCAYKEKSACV